MAAIKPGECHCGCGGLTPLAPWSHARRGMRRGEPYRFIAGHQCRTSPVEYIEDENGCWIWQRARARTGYGLLGGGRYAHRVLYERHKGPIAPGLTIDHLCRVRLCVNPDHLEAVPQAVNSQRGSRTRLTAEQVIAMRRAVVAEGKRMKEVAVEYGVRPSVLSMIVRGLRWPNIPDYVVPRVRRRGRA